MSTWLKIHIFALVKYGVSAMVEGKFVSYLGVSTARQGRSGLGLEAQRQAASHRPSLAASAPTTTAAFSLGRSEGGQKKESSPEPSASRPELLSRASETGLFRRAY